MEALLAIVLLIAVVGLIGWLGGAFATLVAQAPVDSLASSVCPRCGGKIGKDAADAAFDRALKFAQDHTYSRVGPDDYSSALTICPNCKTELIFWIINRTLHLRTNVSADKTSGTPE